MSAAIAALFDRARAQLADVATIRLGELAPSRRILGIVRAPRIVPGDRAWHLGVLLLPVDPGAGAGAGTDVGVVAGVCATGDIVRAHEEVRRGFAAQSQRERAAFAAAARRGGYAEGEVAHFGWQRLDLDAVARGEASGPLRVVDGVPQVRWSRAGYRPLAGYLDERIALLRDPPPGA